MLQKIVEEKLLLDRAAVVHYFLAGALAMAKEDARAFQAAKRAVEIDHGIAIVPQAQLAANTTFRVDISAVVNAAPTNLSWVFTTGTRSN